MFAKKDFKNLLKKVLTTKKYHARMVVHQLKKRTLREQVFGGL